MCIRDRIENIHDDALTFEPIHRFLTGINGYELMQDWTYYCEIHGMDLSEVTQQGDAEQMCIRDRSSC